MKYIIGGSIYGSNPQQLVGLFSILIPELRSEHQILGYDIEFGNDHMGFFLNSRNGREYFLHVNYQGTEDEIAKFSNELQNALLAADILFSFSYWQEDSGYNPISDEVDFNHPEFGK